MPNDKRFEMPRLEIGETYRDPQGREWKLVELGPNHVRFVSAGSGAKGTMNAQPKAVRGWTRV